MHELGVSSRHPHETTKQKVLMKVNRIPFAWVTWEGHCRHAGQSSLTWLKGKEKNRRKTCRETGEKYVQRKKIIYTKCIDRLKLRTTFIIVSRSESEKICLQEL